MTGTREVDHYRVSYVGLEKNPIRRKFDATAPAGEKQVLPLGGLRRKLDRCPNGIVGLG